MSKRMENAARTAETEVFMKLDIREKKVLYVYGCPDYYNTVTRLKWLVSLTVDQEALAAGTCPENGNGRLQRLAFLLLSSSPHGDGRIFQGKEIYEGCGVKHKS